ncbi:MAG TPA: DUF4388 domain-containing protein [Gemmatimonas aurantiaca]|uniref:PatA-like N-terminal domain-containing protein n=2 Tax=Gemmatimonas aurantiaca TaxID=173480 RepID=C1A891_GEMAT|nr:DUF4388 domain-containing protein [Gemmatimonas aurantiaca]BAH38451.1 hypothetical protein GAU_1409 [Gemmatimonas aurantiaca T-27]HCT56221.1 DUF4388 domain-containing protein [Gemmatimonas aurantiaca]
MGIEGRLRDLGLTDVLQLLSGGRKSGTLYCDAPLLGRRIRLGFLQGQIVEAVIDDATTGTSRAVTTNDIREVVHEGLRWRDGSFRFASGEVPSAQSSIRVAVEPLLMDSARQAEVWSRIEGRVSHARVVPTFIDIEPEQLPLLRLSSQQWEILTHIDGERDLVAIAEVMDRELTETAELVHDLIVAGLLVLREAAPVPRRNPTPPVSPVIAGANDLWIPGADPEDAEAHFGEDQDDTVFDPVQWGVFTDNGLPRRSTPWPPPRVAPPLPEPSLDQRELVGVAEGRDGPLLQRLGDDCARRGDLASAISHWADALDATVPVADVNRVREVISLATRLHALLQP